MEKELEGGSRGGTSPEPSYQCQRPGAVSHTTPRVWQSSRTEHRQARRRWPGRSVRHSRPGGCRALASNYLSGRAPIAPAPALKQRPRAGFLHSGRTRCHVSVLRPCALRPSVLRIQSKEYEAREEGIRVAWLGWQCQVWSACQCQG